MENASKALLMAGGVLLAMMVIAFALFAWGKFGEFYDSKDELKDVEDVAKFNEQFTAYQRNDVHGYELISLANKVADYNFRFSNYTAADAADRNAQNDQKYNPITMIITLSRS